MTGPCPFCDPDRDAVAANGTARTLIDGFPSADGHLLVVPRRHVGHVRDLTAAELADVFALVHEAASGPGDHTIGINDGPAAGQTVPHLHVHVIPRRPGDVADPRGGIRWVLPDTADYWTDTTC